MKSIKIAIASGKGGTGKTMVSTSLAASLALDHKIQFIDCDVEAPNAHLFLRPNIEKAFPAVIMVPEIVAVKCSLCGLCIKECMFNALAKIGETVMLFRQLCHGCGNCSLICPEEAINEKPRQIGWLKKGISMHGMAYLMGELTISEPMPTPVIRQIKSLMDEGIATTILDSPPGASCSVLATINDADFILLVTEPTPFGLHDLKQMLGIIELTRIPAGVIINRDGIGDDGVKTFLRGTDYPILMEIPYKQNIAKALAEGKILSQFMPEYRKKFRKLHHDIISIINNREN